MWSRQPPTTPTGLIYSISRYDKAIHTMNSTVCGTLCSTHYEVQCVPSHLAVRSTEKRFAETFDEQTSDQTLSSPKHSQAQRVKQMEADSTSQLGQLGGWSAPAFEPVLQRPRPQAAPFTELPCELVTAVFQFLSFQDLLRAQRCCRRWHNLLSRPKVVASCFSR